MTMTTQYQRGRHMNDLLFTFLRDDVALIRCDNIMKDNIGLYFFLNFLYTQGHKSGIKLYTYSSPFIFSNSIPSIRTNCALKEL